MRKTLGFTLIELSVVLVLISVLMSLVVVRFGMSSTPQATIQEARRLGNLLILYREKAMSEERLYALKIDAAEYVFVQPAEKTIQAVENSQPLCRIQISQPVKITKITSATRNLAMPLIVFFTPKGIVNELWLDISIEEKCVISVRVDPVINEIVYAEP